MALANDRQLDLRKKLLRRLVWKVPVVVGLVTFALWWEARKQTEKTPSGQVWIDSRTPSGWDGAWQGKALYPEHGNVIERFFFLTDGEKLSGTATYLKAEHPIEDGRLAGEEISFSVRVPVAGGGERRIYYRGNAAAGRVKLNIQGDGGPAPMEITLSRSGKVL